MILKPLEIDVKGAIGGALQIDDPAKIEEAALKEGAVPIDEAAKIGGQVGVK